MKINNLTPFIGALNGSEPLPTSKIGSKRITTAQVAALGQEVGMEGAAVLAAIYGALIAADGTSKISFMHGGLGAVLRSLEDRERERVSIRDFGGVGSAAGTDQYDAFEKACAYMASIGGGELIIPPDESGLVYGISETIQLPENSIMRFTGGQIKVLGQTTFDAAIIGVPGARNILVDNPQIDCNNVPAACGIILRRNNQLFRVVGGVIRNSKHDNLPSPGFDGGRKGGRAINIEAGVDTDDPDYGARNAYVIGTTAINCYEAVTISGGVNSIDPDDDQRSSNIRIDMMAEKCESGIGLFGTGDSYPHTPKDMGAVVRLTGRNVGKAATYDRPHGIVNSDRGGNVEIHLNIQNDDGYVAGSIWRGDASNIHMKASVTGDLSEGIFNFSSYAEKPAIEIDADATYTASGNTLSSLRSIFDIKHRGTSPEVAILPIFAAEFLDRIHFTLRTDTITSGKPCTAQMANKQSCWMSIYNEATNATIEGYLTDIGSTITFADYENARFLADQKGAIRARANYNGVTDTMLGGYNCLIERSVTGRYFVTFDRPMPDANYTIHLTCGANDTSNQVDDFYDLTPNGFTIDTYSAGILANKARIHVSACY